MTKLLFDLLNTNSVSGNESPMTEFLIDHIRKRKDTWKVQPEVFFGDKLHDCLLLKFGNPKGAVFAHIDTIGFSTRYENQLLAIGGPEIEEGPRSVGEDSLAPISFKIILDDDLIFQDFPRAIHRGTLLSFEQSIIMDDEYIQAAYLDNRLGIYNCLKLCEELENGWIVFSTYEEHGGGSVPFLIRFIQEVASISFALISDITWITEGVQHHQGVAISLRDKYIPRKRFLDKILGLANESGIPYQIEVEGSGGSDGREIQFSPYPIDWCFIGAAEDNVHTPYEKVSLKDLQNMIDLYKYLMKRL